MNKKILRSVEEVWFFPWVGLELENGSFGKEGIEKVPMQHCGAFLDKRLLSLTPCGALKRRGFSHGLASSWKRNPMEEKGSKMLRGDNAELFWKKGCG